MPALWMDGGGSWGRRLWRSLSLSKNVGELIFFATSTNGSRSALFSKTQSLFSICLHRSRSPYRAILRLGRERRRIILSREKYDQDPCKRGCSLRACRGMKWTPGPRGDPRDFVHHITSVQSMSFWCLLSAEHGEMGKLVSGGVHQVFCSAGEL